MLFSIVRHHCCKQSIINRIVRNKSAIGAVKFDVHDIKHQTKVPLKPTVNISDIKTEEITIDKATIELLQRLALVNLSDK